MVLFSMTAMFTSVGATGHDASGIASIDYLDFSAKNNKWVTDNPATGSFGDKDMIQVDGTYYYPYAVYIDDDSPSSQYNKNLDRTFVQDGEVIRLTATAQENPGIAFRFSQLNTFAIGAQTEGKAEYVKIRFKNNSPSTKITFMGTNQSWGAGKLDQRIRATIDVEPNSSEWQTVTISMVDGTFNTTGSKAWGSFLKEFAIFPFGYNKDNEAIVNDKYYVDIDYVVIGSYEYVTGYQSAIETKENAAVEFDFVSEPTKKEYYLGETIDLTGLQASIKYGEDKNGDPLYPDEIATEVSAVYNFDKPLDDEGNPIEADSWDTTVTLMYGSLILEYDVKVYDIKNIEFIYETDKATDIDNKVYDRISILQGNGFTPTGIKVKVNYAKVENGVNTSATKEIYEVDLIGTEFTDEVELSEGGYYEYLVTINYHGHLLYLPVKLIDIAELVVTPIDETKDAIYYGTDLNFKNKETGLSTYFNVICKYTDGSEKALADTGLKSYLTITCDPKTTGGDATATLNLFNSAYAVDVTKEVTVTIQTPKDITVSLKTKEFDIDQTIGNNIFTVRYDYGN